MAAVYATLIIKDKKIREQVRERVREILSDLEVDA